MERYIVMFEGSTKGKATLQVNVVQAENKEHGECKFFRCIYS